MIMDIKQYIREITHNAKQASRKLAVSNADTKNTVLRQMSEHIIECAGVLKAANSEDLEAGRSAGLSGAMLDRLELTDRRIEGMAESLRSIAALKDPVGGVIDGWTLPNGLQLRKVRVPLGVVCIIYESRPDVTADAAALCLKSGNAVILRGGKEAIRSNMAIYRLLRNCLENSELPAACVQLIETIDRTAVPPLLTAEDSVDVVIPRGGKGLIKKVMETATVPVVKHYDGVCHTYVDAGCNIDTALKICENAKCQRPGTCNAMETLLVSEEIAGQFLPKACKLFVKRGVELRGCSRTLEILPDVKKAEPSDWRTEYLDMILSVRVVRDVGEAIEHINAYGSGHSDAIVTGNLANAENFQAGVDSAAVYVNSSTRFTDGGQFGLGAEIGISTNKLHARGPMALEELTTYKWLINGNGQVRD